MCRAAAAAALAGSAMMFAALFLTFASAPFMGGPVAASFTRGSLPVFLASSNSLRVGPDGGVALALVIAVAAASALFLVGIGPRVTSLAALVCSLAGLGFAGFEATNAARRLLHRNPAFGQAQLGAGFYLFISGAGVAAVAALAVLLLGLRPETDGVDVASPALPVADPT